MSGYGLAAGAVLAAIGTGTSMYAQNQNQKNQNNQLEESQLQQQNLERQGAAQVAQTTQKVAQANANGPAQQLLASYQKALATADPTQGIISVPGGSKRYAESAASAKANVNDYATAMAGNDAVTGGAQLQRIGSGNDIANTASNLGLINGQSVNAQGVLKAQLAGDQANPWTTALGKVVQGAGMGMVSGSLASGMGGSASAAGGDFTGVDPSTGLATAPTFAGGAVTPAYSTGFNAATATGYSNPYL